MVPSPHFEMCPTCIDAKHKKPRPHQSAPKPGRKLPAFMHDLHGRKQPHVEPPRHAPPGTPGDRPRTVNDAGRHLVWCLSNRYGNPRSFVPWHFLTRSNTGLRSPSKRDRHNHIMWGCRRHTPPSNTDTIRPSQACLYSPDTGTRPVSVSRCSPASSKTTALSGPP